MSNAAHRKRGFDSGQAASKSKAMVERKNSLVVRLDDEEMAMIRAVAEAGDEPMSRALRRMIRTVYVERCGLKPPPKSGPRKRT